jgi:hypothetical protein
MLFVLYYIQKYFRIFVCFLQVNGMCNSNIRVFVSVVKQHSFRTCYEGIYEQLVLTRVIYSNRLIY